jgi:hypothetical protein
MMLRLTIVSIIGSILSFLLYSLHGIILETYDLLVSFSLVKNYLFHLSFLFFVIIVLEVVFIFSPSQIGFSYLGLILAKLGVFILVFKSVFFESESVDMTSRLSLVMPLMIYIMAETAYCGYILTKVDNAM